VEGSADHQRFAGDEAKGLVFHGLITYEGAEGFLYVDRFGFRATKDAISFVPLGGGYNRRQTFDWREEGEPKNQK
jgi:hypothetical protein